MTPLKYQSEQDTIKELLLTRCRQCSNEVADLSREVHRLHNVTALHSVIFLAAVVLFIGLAVVLFANDVIVSGVRMQSVISESLLLYAKDETGMRNFAHPYQGGDVIRALTSDTYSPKGRPSNVVAWQPETVIGTDLQAGRCWSFSGASGHLGILLADNVSVTNITVEHISVSLLPQPDIAPKDIVIWAHVEDESTMSLYRSRIANSSATPFLFPVEVETLPEPMTPTSFVPIASFTYDVHSRFFRQMFMAWEEVREVQLSTRIVVVHVKNNWGNEDRTCLYRFRVHGISTK